MSDKDWSKYTLDLKVVDKARQLRAVVDDLHAEYERLRKADSDNFKRHEAILDAMKANPSEATARAYIASLAEPSHFNKVCELGEKRRACLQELVKLNEQILTQLGCATTDEDWQR